MQVATGIRAVDIPVAVGIRQVVEIPQVAGPKVVGRNRHPGTGRKTDRWGSAAGSQDRAPRTPGRLGRKKMH